MALRIPVTSGILRPSQHEPGSRVLRSLPLKEVLIEFLTAMSGGGEYLRRTAAAIVRRIVVDPATKVLPQSSLSFLRGLELYERRPDKAYSLVDCISMNSMRDEGITAILSNDHHFTQEGFTLLLHRQP